MFKNLRPTPSKRHLGFLASLALTTLGLCQFSFAQEGARYAEERIKGDLAALEARQELSRTTYNESKKQYLITLRNLRKELGAEVVQKLGKMPLVHVAPRMIGKYGVGKESAMIAVPGAAMKLVELHTLIRASALCQCMPKRLDQIIEYTQKKKIPILESKILASAKHFAAVEELYLDYWGYNNQVEQKPTLDQERWTIALRYHNVGSYIEDPREKVFTDLLAALMKFNPQAKEKSFWEQWF